MKRSVQDTPIVFIGAGNLATNLAKALYKNGFRIVQVYSRTKEAACALAQAVEAGYTTELSEVSKDARLYIVSLKDDAFVTLLPEIVAGKEDTLLVHTAGSIPMNVWEGKTSRYGVFYPMQTFSKQREVDFRVVPFFIESNSSEDTELLKAIASVLSEKVYEATSEQRRSLHLAAVFTCNFTNHMYALASELLKKYDLPFNAMLPLIDETARKVHELEPKQAQTGPAVRYDENVINKHLEMLAGEPEMQELYRLVLPATVRQSPEPDGKYQDVRQPRPLHAAPDKQAYPAALPQHRCIAVQDARQKDLLQRGGRTDIPLRTRKEFPQGRYSLLQGAYP